MVVEVMLLWILVNRNFILKVEDKMLMRNQTQPKTIMACPLKVA